MDIPKQLRRPVRSVCLVILCPVLLSAQVTSGPQGYGYAVAPAAPGREEVVHFAAGFEVPVYKGLGAGGELGYLVYAGELSEGIGVLSPNASYNFMGSTPRKVVPFVTGGYSLFFRSGIANGFNFGGGINYWMRKRFGMRFEFRDQVLEREHYYTFRTGIVFRSPSWD